MIAYCISFSDIFNQLLETSIKKERYEPTDKFAASAKDLQTLYEPTGKFATKREKPTDPL